MPDPIDDLAHELGRQIRGEVRTDTVTRLLYSTDASIYQVEPCGVAFPRHVDELQAIVEAAARYQVPLLARGAGSSLAGQAIGPGLVVDCSRHLTQILEIDAEARQAVVEPGVVLNALNRAAAAHRLQFGPDPASAERATVGGSLANNATGAHSILYGMAADHLRSGEMTLSDGSLANFSEISLAEAGRRAAGSPNSLEGRLYRAVLKIREEQAEAIRRDWPRVWRRASGYNLNYLLPWSPSRPPGWPGDGSSLDYPPVAPGCINLATLFAGSEGTLAVLKRATLNLVPIPAQRLLAVLAFPSLIAACEAVPEILTLDPSAIELIPQVLLRLARSVPAYAAQLAFIEDLPGGSDPSAILAVEFSGEELSRLHQQAGRLEKLGPVLLAETPAAQRQIWGVRKVGLGLLQSRAGDFKSTAFMEDLAVPVEHLGEFVRELERIFAEHHTSADIYAHASAGCLHIRPILNLKTGQGVRDLRSIAEQAIALAARLGGVASGEHGDGLARSEWLPQVFGETVMAAFRELKAAADPVGLLNPGKIVSSAGGAPPRMDVQLRFGYEYQAQAWTPVMDFGRQAGLAGAIEQCNGAGVCRKQEGVMCPSFQATQNEMHSTRGRANLLRAMISGRFAGRDLAEKAVYEALDLCLACKGCRAECPSGVDMAKLKYEFSHEYYQHHRRRLRDYLFGYIGEAAGFGRRFHAITNLLLSWRWSRAAAERMFGLAARRAFPRLSARPLSARLPALLESQAEGEPVLFLRDAFSEYFYPEVGEAGIRVLQAAGCNVQVLPVIGAGRTLISKGFLEAARKQARLVLAAVEGMDPEGRAAVVGVEPSEVYTLREEYLDLIGGEEGVERLAGRAWMVDEYLTRPGKNGILRIVNLVDQRQLSCPENLHEEKPQILLHGHCYQKAQPPAEDGYPTGVQATMALLQAAGYPVELIDSGCCGMAGAFGFEAEHYEVSMQVGELKLLPAVRQAQEQTIIAASGVSCQGQIEDGAGRRAVHPLTLL